MSAAIEMKAIDVMKKDAQTYLNQIKEIVQGELPITSLEYGVLINNTQRQLESIKESVGKEKAKNIKFSFISPRKKDSKQNLNTVMAYLKNRYKNLDIFDGTEEKIQEENEEDLELLEPSDTETIVDERIGRTPKKEAKELKEITVLKNDIEDRYKLMSLSELYETSMSERRDFPVINTLIKRKEQESKALFDRIRNLEREELKTAKKLSQDDFDYLTVDDIIDIDSYKRQPKIKYSYLTSNLTPLQKQRERMQYMEELRAPKLRTYERMADPKISAKLERASQKAIEKYINPENVQAQRLKKPVDTAARPLTNINILDKSNANVLSEDDLFKLIS